MTLKDELHHRYTDCICRHCRDAGCRVKLGKISKNHVLISGTKYQEVYHYTKNLCDFIVYDRACENPIRIAVLELKSGDVDAEDIDVVHEQLQNGASIADNMASSVGVSEFLPFLVKKRALNVMAHKILIKEKYKIHFRQSAESIRVMRSSNSLWFSN